MLRVDAINDRRSGPSRAIDGIAGGILSLSRARARPFTRLRNREIYRCSAVGITRVRASAGKTAPTEWKLSPFEGGLVYTDYAFANSALQKRASPASGTVAYRNAHFSVANRAISASPPRYSRLLILPRENERDRESELVPEPHFAFRPLRVHARLVPLCTPGFSSATRVARLVYLA